jgi:hypothetical protein
MKKCDDFFLTEKWKCDDGDDVWVHEDRIYDVWFCFIDIYLIILIFSFVFCQEYSNIFK